MKAIIVSYKRGRHLIHPRQVLIKVSGISDKARAQALVGKKVVFTTKSGKALKGIITRPHGGKGVMRVRFKKGVPGQAIGQEITIIEKGKQPKAAEKSAEKSKLMEEYEKETGKHAIWHGKVTKGFKEWKSKNK